MKQLKHSITTQGTLSNRGCGGSKHTGSSALQAAVTVCSVEPCSLPCSTVLVVSSSPDRRPRARSPEPRVEVEEVGGLTGST